MKSLLGPCTQFQLEPFTYPFFWDLVEKQMMPNTWAPQEIQVGGDLAVYKNLQQDSSPASRAKLRHFNAIMGQLTAFDMLRSEDATVLLLQLIQPEEIKHFLIRLMWEERLHTASYRYIVQNLGMPETGKDSIYEMWMNVPEMRARVEYAEGISSKLAIIVKMNMDDDLQIILQSMIFFFLIFEKVWFLLNLQGPVQHIARTRPGQDREFIGAAEQFQYIARDEELHILGGVNLIRAFIKEHPSTLTKSFLQSIQTMFEESLHLEDSFIQYCAKDGQLPGYSAHDHSETARFFANLGMKAINLPEPFPGAKHKFSWISEMLELKKEKNFFESRPTEYQTGGRLEWGEDEDDGDTWPFDLERI